MELSREEFGYLFGEFIKYKREEDNLTLKELALRINGDFQNIHRLERGSNSPSAYNVFKLAKAFGMPLGDFIREFDEFAEMKLKEMGHDLDSPVDNAPTEED